jgi:hypothetical protein
MTQVTRYSWLAAAALSLLGGCALSDRPSVAIWETKPAAKAPTPQPFTSQQLEVEDLLLARTMIVSLQEVCTQKYNQGETGKAWACDLTTEHYRNVWNDRYKEFIKKYNLPGNSP